MSLGSRVLVATDLSEAADEAIRQGHERADADGGELVICHVVPNPMRLSPLFPQDSTEDLKRTVDFERKAVAFLDERVPALTGRAPEAFKIRVENGQPGAAILHAADEIKATLVVVSSRGMSGLDRLLLGSVAERVVRYAHCPVLVARPHEKTGKILVATDFSDPALPAVAYAAEQARHSGARITLMHGLDVMPDPAIGWGAPFGASWVVMPEEMRAELRKGAEDALKSMLERFGVDGDVLVREGDAASAILDAARSLPADLVVLATRGRTGISRMVLGSVAEKVIRHAPCSVLAVRHGGEG